MEKNGIFISYRHSYSHFAGRIYDELERRGFSPFMDVYQMQQGNFHAEIGDKIRECPYFLLVLFQGCLEGIKENDVFFNEILTALECKKPSELLIIADRGFMFPSDEELPEKLLELSRRHCDFISHEHFSEGIDRLVRNIQPDKLSGAVNWRELITKNANAILMSRSEIEHKFATNENRFGRDMIDAIKEGKQYEGQQIVRRICLSCYAASIVFNPGRNMVDDRAFDNGLMSNIFRELLRDPDFSLEIIINAPGSKGAEEAIRDNMLGNNALEDYPEAVFLSAYAGLDRLIKEDPVFRTAYKEHRFRFYLTDIIMRGAIFWTEYKEAWNEFDNIKFDLYSYDMDSNMSRRCMVFFNKGDMENYKYFCRMYEYMHNHRLDQREIIKNHDKWLAEWKDIQEVL